MQKIELSPNCPFATVEQTARFLGVSQRHVYDMCRRGELKSTKFGRNLRINKAALIEQAGVTEAEYLAAVIEGGESNGVCERAI